VSIRDLLLPNGHDLFMREVNAKAREDGCGGYIEWAVKHPGEHLYAMYRTKVRADLMCAFCCASEGAPYRCPGPWQLRGRTVE